MDPTLFSSALYVDMNIFAKNIQILTRRHKAFIPVLKSDAYGLGLLPIAHALEAEKAVKMLAVAQVLEGAQLRQAGIRKEILVMGGTLPRQWSAAADLGLTLTVTRPGMVTALNGLGKQVNVHLKIETGLNRNGICPGDELAGVMDELRNSCYVNLTGTYSHFAAAEARDISRCMAQKLAFDRALGQLSAGGMEPGLRHMSNSAAAEWMGNAGYDAVRIGRGLYMDAQDDPTGEIREVASWRAAIVGLRDYPAGTRLGYGKGIILERDTRVAMVNVGYGDGLNHRVAAGGPALVEGKTVRFLGCCMDQSFLDVTDIPCTIGTEVTLFGYDGMGNHLPSQEVARLCDDEGCGLTAALGQRVARIYI